MTVMTKPCTTGNDKKAFKTYDIEAVASILYNNHGSKTLIYHHHHRRRHQLSFTDDKRNNGYNAKSKMR